MRTRPRADGFAPLEHHHHQAVYSPQYSLQRGILALGECSIYLKSIARILGMADPGAMLQPLHQRAMWWRCGCSTLLDRWHHALHNSKAPNHYP